MNLSAKCNCCVCEPVCKFKEVYQIGVESILNATIKTGESENGAFSFWKVKDCPHIEVSIKCPHMITKGEVKINR
jgi:hypothetical protein